MQIKVKETKRHKIIHPYPDGVHDFEITVAEVKLILVECKSEEALIYLPVWKHEEGKLRLFDIKEVHPSAIYKAYKPILISETEKIEVGDQYIVIRPDYISGINKCDLIRDNGEVCYFDGGNKNHTIYSEKEFAFKILALLEHFSPEQLQMIVDGKLKDGDKVLVECEENGWIINKEFPASVKNRYFIKLNSSNHITLYPIEEKMYTKEQIIVAYEAGVIDGCNPNVNDTNGAKWFEQNVK